MFRIYSKDQSGKLYLSPYADVHISEELLSVRQMIFNQTLTFPCSREDGKKLVRSLQDGIRDEDLLKLISGISTADDLESEEVLRDWIRAGVLE